MWKLFASLTAPAHELSSHVAVYGSVKALISRFGVFF